VSKSPAVQALLSSILFLILFQPSIAFITPFLNLHSFRDTKAPHRGQLRASMFWHCHSNQLARAVASQTCLQSGSKINLQKSHKNKTQYICIKSKGSRLQYKKIKYYCIWKQKLSTYLGCSAISTASTRIASPSINLLLSHFQQRLGHGSPQKPMQLCPQGSVSWQSSKQGSLLHDIPHCLVHLLCTHP
jgi:hypothetical protein